MKKIRVRLVLLLWFMASMSIANTHIHHDATEHSDCVKCFAYNMLSGADASIAEPIRFDPPVFFLISHPRFNQTQKALPTSFDARAPPLA